MALVLTMNNSKAKLYMKKMHKEIKDATNPVLALAEPLDYNGLVETDVVSKLAFGDWIPQFLFEEVDDNSLF